MAYNREREGTRMLEQRGAMIVATPCELPPRTDNILSSVAVDGGHRAQFIRWLKRKRDRPLSPRPSPVPNSFLRDFAKSRRLVSARFITASVFKSLSLALTLHPARNQSLVKH